MSPAASAVALARCRELGCTPALVADAEAGRIDPLDLVRWVEAWARERRRAPLCGRCGKPCGVLVALCRGCLAAEDAGRA